MGIETKDVTEKTMTNFTCAFPWKFFPRLFSAIILMVFATGCNAEGLDQDTQTLASTSSKKCYTVDKAERLKHMCPESHPEIDASLCYKRCKKGYKGVGPVCWKKCKKKERDDGAFCAKKCSGFGCVNPNKWKLRAKKSYGRGIGRKSRKVCNEKHKTINIKCGKESLSHCTLRETQCVWDKPGYPLCKRHHNGKKWECCDTE